MFPSIPPPPHPHILLLTPLKDAKLTAHILKTFLTNLVLVVGGVEGGDGGEVRKGDIFIKCVRANLNIFV